MKKSSNEKFIKNYYIQDSFFVIIKVVIVVNIWRKYEINL